MISTPSGETLDKAALDLPVLDTVSNAGTIYLVGWVDCLPTTGQQISVRIGDPTDAKPTDYDKPGIKLTVSWQDECVATCDFPPNVFDLRELRKVYIVGLNEPARILAIRFMTDDDSTYDLMVYPKVDPAVKSWPEYRPSKHTMWDIPPTEAETKVKSCTLCVDRIISTPGLRPVAPVSPPTAPVSPPTAPVFCPVAPVSRPVAPVSRPTAPVSRPTAPVFCPTVALRMCRNGVNCWKKGCTWAHPPRDPAPAPRPCRNGVNCWKKGCTWAHPLRDPAAAPRMCKHGVNCWKKGCTWAHPPGHVSA
jgi:hypothetical protein